MTFLVEPRTKITLVFVQRLHCHNCWLVLFFSSLKIRQQDKSFFEATGKFSQNEFLSLSYFMFNSSGVKSLEQKRANEPGNGNGVLGDSNCWAN